LRLGEEFGVDIVNMDLELGSVKTFGDLMNVAWILKQQSTVGVGERS
jgi:hypothetical protein